jgi:chemotaxis protein methyltransferase CheR
VLKEEGLYERTRIYATDINATVLDKAKDAAFSIERMRDYTENYIRAGGARAFSEYYETQSNVARFDPSLSQNIVFAQHNLVSDKGFNEFHMIMCRNVLIYFDRPLQSHVHGLFHGSLVNFGVLALGHKESVKFSPYADAYAELDVTEKLYKKVD